MTRARDAKGKFVKLHPTAITAAASVLPAGSIENMPRMLGTSMQERAWRLWRILGVLHFPTTFKARQVGRLGWNVTVNGELLEPEAAEAAMESVTAPLGTEEVTTRIALNLEVAGEVFYARLKDEWRVLASTRPKLKELLKQADIIVRGLQPDPVNDDEPFTAVMAALGTADQIRLMAAMSRGQDRNRLAQRGILLVPKEGQFPEGDDFQAKLEASMTAPIADEYAASAVVPLKVDFPAEFIDKWKHLVLESPYDDKLMERIDKTIGQLALELDLPPEMLLGNMDSNHWNAWLSSEENVNAFVVPLGVATGEVIARAMMEAVDGAVEITVTPDPAEMLARSASVEDAFSALKLGVVGFDYVRRIIGADEDDAPTPEEIELILQLTGNAPQAAAPEPVDAAPELPEASPEPSANGNGVAASLNAAVDPRAIRLDELARRLTDIDFRLLSVLEGLAGMASEHARASVDTEETGNQHAVQEEMERLGLAWSREVSQARKVLTELGIDAKGEEWDTAQFASVELLVDEMTTYVTENLKKTDSELPALPVLVLRRVLATAGGSGSATVAAVKVNPPPTFADPQGFAIGVLPLKELKKQNVAIVQWRFRYGPLSRTNPFEPHRAVNGQYMTSDGFTSEGWYPGDHKGCECSMDPVLREVATPAEVSEEVA